MIPEESGIARDKLIQPDVMVQSIVWLCSGESDGINGMRFIGALWDPDLALDARIQAAGAPVAWSQIESRSIYPGD